MAEKIDRRVKRTRRLVSEAFIQLVLEKGYDGVRIEDIIEQADVARTTFYTHFKDKGDLLQYVADSFRHAAKENLPHIQLDAQGLPSVEQLTITFQNIADHAQVFQVALDANGMPKLYDQIHQIIVEMIEVLLTNHAEATGREPAVPISLSAHHFTGALLSSAKWWLQENRLYLIPPDEMAKLFVQIHRDSLTAES